MKLLSSKQQERGHAATSRSQCGTSVRAVHGAAYAKRSAQMPAQRTCVAGRADRHRLFGLLVYVLYHKYCTTKTCARRHWISMRLRIHFPAAYFEPPQSAATCSRVQNERLPFILRLLYHKAFHALWYNGHVPSPTARHEI